jgi:hypothetical protein
LGQTVIVEGPEGATISAVDSPPRAGPLIARLTTN